jgi:hypothetical protein
MPEEYLGRSGAADDAVPDHDTGQSAGDPIAPHQSDACIDRYAYCLGATGLLASVDEAIALLDMPPLYWMPNLPRQVVGVASVHGFVVPVLDLAVLFGPVAPASEPARWLLVFGSERAAVAVQLQTLPSKRQFRIGDRCEPVSCPPALAAHVRGAYPDAGNATGAQHDGVIGPGMWLDFDHRSYFDSGKLTS